MTLLCSICRAPAAQRCSGCQQVGYCGRDHQRQDWKAQHRHQCRRFKVVRSERLGRHLVATRSIRQGEIIYRDTPYAVGPKIANVPVCLGCNRNLVPLLTNTVQRFYECTQCGWPLCGNGCEGADQHRVECGVLSGSGYRPNIRPHPADPERRESAYCVIVPLRVLLLERTAPEKYAEIERFESHLEQRLASPLYGVLRSNLVPFVRSVLGLRQYSEDMILKVSAILDTNCYEIRQPLVKVRALYPLGAMLSHDCVPNTKHYFDDRLGMVLVATIDIPEGAVINVSYTQPLLGTLQRRLALRQAKCFDCSCDRCTDPTEFGTHVGGFRCPSCQQRIKVPKATGCDWVIPSDPASYRTDWRCQNRKCTYQEPAQEYARRCEKLQAELLALDRTEPDDYEAFLVRHEPILHGWNAYVLQAKYALTQLLAGRREQAPNDAPARRLVDLCRDLLGVAQKLEPGYGYFRTKLLLELANSLDGLRTRGVILSQEQQEYRSAREELERIAKTDPTVKVNPIPSPDYNPSVVNQP
ncbi:SET domain-containing protein SmydA-8-like [Anopheles ziemanni]|uniref:SET domain-containing protein SmydA-8-like n=1 Tax=Anopheles coustani TaxID=139045 RepID=UPI00265A768C|nr:SET domain-containing protein SmydA-8-like [Anopheles coustani]XP_058175532.1 SET domain-containing protein SmydA-8-like [Anopheles ziemanni]